ncbi:MAG: hypothetical protein BRC47_03740 [Cyanobacteria bacterium QS_7_48_42]|nr:MAG: hypothetical protein BRC35_05180 [Cyanobacteria bacterium QH_10_48_56]PSO60690.1 MAG: hypothetical protein BRC39_09445 [Cyanobacteria bacterium QH_7_48_89]PSO62624.1 MAG: hypothetical protein BRC36_09775 [Cyanobacteria bacterium QH_2_48_84]PSO65195.1 MAG: hypothetical protein BRC38_09610 [Cyanobacteria bacterium QH_6_48_35]PSO69224.1 MAG: hypothetical protein BRC42_12410 [Cyanobacteria bacterium QS_1_48_34]PSO76287.1 MAG: hypothetical protein BRC44_16685 [Cyanobacteria bacterium QS_4_4
MRPWRFWRQTIILHSRQNPPCLVEALMLLLAIGLLASWASTEQQPYLILGLSYIIGSSSSTLVREAHTRSRQPRFTQIAAALLLIASIYSLVSPLF